MKKSLLNLFLVCIGLTIGMSAHAQLRVKPYTQSTTVGDAQFEGEGLDLTGVVNPESGLFLAISLNGGESKGSGEFAVDSYFSMTEISIGKSTLSGVTYFGGLSQSKLDSWFSYGGNRTTEINGLFGGLGFAKPFAGGVVSASGSALIGGLSTRQSIENCDNYYYYDSWYSYSSTYCYNQDQWHDSDVLGFAYSLAYAYPVTNSITIGVEHKSRAFYYQGYLGEDQEIELNMNRIFVDISFR